MFKISKFLSDYTVSHPTRQFFIITVMVTAGDHKAYRVLPVARSSKCSDCNQLKSLGVNNGETVYESVLCLFSPFLETNCQNNHFGICHAMGILRVNHFI
jgi:hypothetical protein